MLTRRAMLAVAAVVVAGGALGAWPALGGARPEGRSVSLRDCAFLAGAWKGAIGEDRAEEHWSAPDGTSILGMFRWVNADGSPGVFEILTITEEEGDVFLRLRHMDAKLQPWASETVPMTLKLAEVAFGKAVFRAVETEKRLAAVTYRCPTPDALNILVEFAGEKPGDPLDFRLKRAAPGAE